MSQTKQNVLALDVGEKRIGLAVGDTIGRLASPLLTLIVDGTEIVRLQSILLDYDIDKIVVGLPRNQSGEQTAQSEQVKMFVKRKIEAFSLPVIFQDESVTSVLAERHLVKNKKTFKKGDIDAHAAAIILQDYLEGL
ncbi:MAG: Holliday junction resolvase RuvX [Candidatus Woesebacteria bacterium]|jgi:putative Holliday junction resolvase